MLLKASIPSRSNRKGYTLVETMMTFALLTILVVLISSSVNMAKYMTIKNRNDSLTRLHIKNTITSLARDLREGLAGYDSACTNPSNPNNFCILNTDSSRIVFKIPEGVSSVGTVLFKTIDYSYNSTSKELLRSEVSSSGTTSPAQVIARKIGSLTFARDSSNSNLVRILVTSADGAYQDRTQVFLRNTR